MNNRYALGTALLCLLINNGAIADDRSITVSGQGKVSLLPDLAIINVSVQSREAKLAMARQKV
ncbi:MAG: SIMPL domain-containing protein, partial [Gammaproteobacteria bacterium]